MSACGGVVLIQARHGPQILRWTIRFVVSVVSPSVSCYLLAKKLYSTLSFSTHSPSWVNGCRQIKLLEKPNKILQSNGCIHPKGSSSTFGCIQDAKETCYTGQMRQMEANELTVVLVKGISSEICRLTFLICVTN